MDGIRPTLSAAQAAPAPATSPLDPLLRFLASPFVALFGALELPPTVQAVSFTMLGAAAVAGGHWLHLLEAAALVLLGFLLHKTQLVLWERNGRPAPWNLFLATATHRLLDAALYVGLALGALVPLHALPWPAWQPFDTVTYLVLCLGALALHGLARTLEPFGATILLRTHLLTARRIPGPSALTPPVRPVVARLFGRGETVVLWCLGVATGQFHALVLLLLAANACLAIEAVALVRLRLRDPEAEASRILGPDWP